MLPIKAYVVEAYYHWIVKSNCTPYLVVNATLAHVEVPVEHVRNGQIVLNMAPQSIRELVFNTSYVSFLTQFSGVTHTVYVPIAAVIAIYAKENGEGKMFEGLDEDHEHPLMQPMPRSHFENKSNGAAKEASHLKVIK